MTDSVLTDIHIAAGVLVEGDQHSGLVKLSADVYVPASREPDGSWLYEIRDERFRCAGGLASWVDEKTRQRHTAHGADDAMRLREDRRRLEELHEIGAIRPLASGLIGEGLAVERRKQRRARRN